MGSFCYPIAAIRGITSTQGAGLGGVVPTDPYSSLRDYTSYWKCDDIAGANFLDSSVNAKTLTQLNSPGSTTGQIGNCRTFVAASSQYGSIASDSTMQRNKNWTISLLAYFSTVPGWQILICKDDGSANREFLLGLNPSGVLELQIIGTAVVTHGTVLSASTWYNIVVTWNNTTKAASIIVNNGTPATGTGGSAILATTAAFMLGAYSSPASLFMNGRIDDVLLWDRVLSAGEITLNYGRTAAL